VVSDATFLTCICKPGILTCIWLHIPKKIGVGRVARCVVQTCAHARMHLFQFIICTVYSFRLPRLHWRVA
jgi:hypothetical protein